MSNEEAIKKQILLLRDGYSIGVYPEEIQTLCNECAREILKFTIINNLGYEQISLTRLGIQEPFHIASLIGFNNKHGAEWFLVDPTYGQFFTNNNFKKYMLDNYKAFSLKLLQQGYIKCTLSNIKAYINGFIYSNAYQQNIDIKEVYNNLYNLFISNDIIKEKTTSKLRKMK